MTDIIVGIDLGTTNSEVAAYDGDRVRILGSGPSKMLPSCVAMSPSGELLVGQAARNQQLLYPDRTIRSIKRKMGTQEKIALGDKQFTPPEVSALLLRELAQWASRSLEAEISQAIITVPAYFSDAQRQATREAGQMAGLEVLRLVNEPTAASLAYGYGEKNNLTVMIYDLGGGTFDVSLVNVQDQVTEVLASHGNNQLGGDDFDQLLLDHLIDAFSAQYDIDLRGDAHRGAYVRLAAAAEQAKKQLSAEPFTTVREESLVQVDGKPLNFVLELSRSQYEQMIRPKIESTLESVSRALNDAGKSPDDVDVVLLVGGSTRTPLVAEILEQRMGKAPRQDVHPDLCVALGAGLLASRSAGHEVDRVLVDVSPYSFGISYLGERDGTPYPHCYKPIIARNTPLPVTRTELFWTSYEYQTKVEIEIFQGEHSDAMHNMPVGDFLVEGLQEIEEQNAVLCRMKLDLNGILEVSATEKSTSLTKKVTISDAARARSDEEISSARERLADVFETRRDVDSAGVATDADTALSSEGFDSDEPFVELKRERSDTEEEGVAIADPQLAKAISDGRTLIGRSRKLFDDLHTDDRSEAVDLNEAVETAIESGQSSALDDANDALREFLFFVEGR